MSERSRQLSLKHFNADLAQGCSDRIRKQCAIKSENLKRRDCHVTRLQLRHLSQALDNACRGVAEVVEDEGEVHDKRKNNVAGFWC